MDQPEQIDCLDKGFVKLLSIDGTDSSVVQAARVSYGEGTETPSSDRALIRYLLKHYHTSPFEMIDVKFHIKLPIFVMRQLVRHRTLSLNEISARYSIMKDEFYIPKELQTQSKNNKQGRGENLTFDQSAVVKNIIISNAEKSYFDYTELVNGTEEFPKLARELARIVLPVNLYTEAYIKADMNNLMKLLRLRMDSHAQYEIRVYADAIFQLVNKKLPVIMEAFDDYILNGAYFSRMDMEVLRQVVDITKLENLENPDNMTPREWRDFKSHFIE